ncbi:MAG: class I SAM-dependent methyltransferase [Solirubrobacterales bacterium]
MLAISPSETLLDVGTGTGAVLREVERSAVPPARRIGVDSSSPMLIRAGAVLAPEVELVHADVHALPFGDASVDLVTCAYLLHLLPADARAGALSEIARLLVGRGRLGVITVAPPRGALAKIVTAPIRVVAERSSGVLAGLRPLNPTKELEEAGFEVEAARRVLAGYPSLCVVARRR